MQEEMLPYYRFSEFMSNENELTEWFEDLSRKGIACCIVRGADERRPYSLWRWGLDHTEKFPNTEPMVGLIVRENNWPDMRERALEIKGETNVSM